MNNLPADMGYCEGGADEFGERFFIRFIVLPNIILRRSMRPKNKVIKRRMRALMRRQSGLGRVRRRMRMPGWLS